MDFGFYTGYNRMLMHCAYTPVFTHLIPMNIYYTLCSLSERWNFIPPPPPHCLYLYSLG